MGPKTPKNTMFSLIFVIFQRNQLIRFPTKSRFLVIFKDFYKIFITLIDFYVDIKIL